MQWMWTRPLIFGLALTMVSGCSSDGDLVSSDPPATIEVTVAGVSYVLDGLFAPYLEQRRPAVVAEISKTPVDVLCVNQVMLEEDKQALAQASHEQFPFFVRIRTDSSTTPNDPRDALGNTPTPPNEPPCATPEVQAKAAELIECGIGHCSTSGGEDGPASAGACLTDYCTAQFLPLLTGDYQHKRCYNCLLYTLLSHVSFAEARHTCANDAQAGFAFRGDNGQMILSKYPLSNERLWVLPSTAWRQAVLSAQVSLPGGVELDVHCAVLQGPHSSSTQPYTGLYANGQPGDDAWLAETLLEAQGVASYVQGNSPTGRAVVVGDLYVGPAYQEEGRPILTGVGLDAFTTFDLAFRRLVAPDYPPTCTLCGDNPLIGGTSSIDAWTSHVFGLGMDDVDVIRTQRIATELAVEISLDGSQPETTMAPVTSRFGLMSTLRIPR